jgi:hypothetical protein
MEERMKKRNPRSQVMFVALGMLSSVASAGEWMTGEQIEKLASGNTTYGKHEFKGFTSY